MSRIALAFTLLATLTGCLNLTGRIADDAGDARVDGVVVRDTDTPDVTHDTSDAVDVAADMDAPISDAAIDASEVADLSDVVDAREAGPDVPDDSKVSDVVDAPDAAPDDVCGLSTCGGACVDTQRDVRHCGSCARDCAALPGVLSASVRCEAGACVIPAGACDASHGDCDGDATTGCEADLTVAASCGACGIVCSEPTPHCGVTGGSRRCDSGCDAPSMRCGMTCSNTANDPSNCGACGNACPAPSNGVAACASGRCGVLCDAGFHLCVGRCVDDALVTSCSARCEPCPLAAHATTTCSSGGCGFTCEASFADCDGDATNGCETDTRTSGAHCGRCGNACAAPTGSVASCVGGHCEVMITCLSGQVLCGSSCQTVGATCLVGVGACARTGTTVCSAAGGGTTCSATPGAGTTEVCDGIDNDCDGLTDEGFCRIAGVCFTDGQRNLTNACQRCVANSMLSASSAWTNETAGVVCRASVGMCDVVEVCDGTGAGCPADSVVSAGTVCRASAGPCDLAEVCTGSSVACPANTLAPSGTSCSAPTSGACMAGVCTCPADRVNCGGACVDTSTSLSNCGACGNACIAPSNATPTCAMGACGFVCDVGFQRVSDRCASLLPAAWTRWRMVTVNNPGASALLDYSVRVTLSSANFVFSDARADGADLLPLGTDFSTRLGWYLEAFDRATQSATLWVRVATIPARGSASFVLAYGNPSATTSSSLFGRYEVYDDFAGTSLDTSQWSAITPAGASISVSGGNLLFGFSVNHNITQLRSRRPFRGGGAIVTATMYNWSRGGNSFNYEAPAFGLVTSSYTNSYSVGLASLYDNQGDTYWGTYQHFFPGSVTVGSGGALAGSAALAVTYAPPTSTCMIDGTLVASTSTGVPPDASDLSVLVEGSNPYDGSTRVTIDRISVVRSASPEPVATIGTPH